MERERHSESPTVLLRISDGSCSMHRAFSDFSQAVRARQRPMPGPVSWWP